MLTGQDLDNEARFFSETTTETSSNNAASHRGAGQQAIPAPRITMVFVEVVGSGSSTSDGAEPLTAWNELQRLRDRTRGEGAAAYALVSRFVCVEGGLPEYC